MKVNVKAGELGLAFTNNIDLETGQVSKPSKAEVDFGTVDLGVVGNTTSIEKNLPAITFQDARGTGEGYTINLHIDDKLKDDTKGSVLNNAVFSIDTANSTATQVGEGQGHTVKGTAESGTEVKTSDSKAEIYKAVKGEGKGLYETTEDNQKITLDLDTTELESDATYTTTATISINPLVEA